MNGKDKLVDRFLAHVAVNAAGCWEWQAQRTHGYGRFWCDNKLHQAHRVIWGWYYGDIPAGMELNHTCNNPGCVNPAHLELVEHKDNIAYRVAQGRCACGENNGNAKLTNDKALEIRARYAEGNTSHRKLAKEYGVSYRTIGHLLKGDTWNSKV